MAQAARLNLRLQKELKLLLTDPPPGASFPTLSDADSSITSIDALLQGPEGTVYSNGVFKIKIQIPERYPFQPPIVTFATPIYHPNIDNGGRICLDILNLPPKGMWQPSLNISTVLTSIGLLLSEPNPDDGLMHEASRDYKYNRQAFDNNARSMTEKYAQVGLTEIARGDNGNQVHAGRSTSQTKMEGSVASVSISEHMKLPVESPGCSNRKNSGEDTSKAPVHNVAKNHTEIGPAKESSKDSSNYSWNFDKLRSTRYKLSPKVQVASHGRINENENTSMSNQCSSVLEIQTASDFPESSEQVGKMASIRDGHVEKHHSTSVGEKRQSLLRVRTEPRGDSDVKLQSIPQCTVSHLGSIRPQEGWIEVNPPKDAIAGKRNSSASFRLKKRGLAGLKPSSEPLGHPQIHLTGDKENLPPLQCLLPQPTYKAAASAVISSVAPESGMCNEAEEKAAISAPKLSETDVKLPLEPSNQPVGRINNVILHPTNYARCGNEACDGERANTFKKPADGSQETDALIVLDSEDSDDDNAPVRSKLSLGKRCWLRKRKSGF